MTKDHILAIHVGRPLDYAVAEHVMGWGAPILVRKRGTQEYIEAFYTQNGLGYKLAGDYYRRPEDKIPGVQLRLRGVAKPPCYSTEINDAWLVNSFASSRPTAERYYAALAEVVGTDWPGALAHVTPAHFCYAALLVAFEHSSKY